MSKVGLLMKKKTKKGSRKIREMKALLDLEEIDYFLGENFGLV